MSVPDPWAELRRHTAARIALGRSGVSLPTAEWLAFGVAHALARDAVHLPFDAEALAGGLAAGGFGTVTVASAAGDRATYLRRPDLGRQLAAASEALLQPLAAAAGDAAAAGAAAGAGWPGGLVVVIGDGLSARAVHAHARPLLLELRPRLQAQGQAIALTVLAHQARVALGDAVAVALGARVVLVLIGERPGLSSPDSLGAYLTWAPRVGCSDAERNCVSNIRPEGQGYAEAAGRIGWLLGAARRLGATGVALKDESESDALAAPPVIKPLPAA